MPVSYEFKGQYTGLKDKNGKEIYKGDILKTNRKYSINDQQIYTYEQVKFGQYDDDEAYSTTYHLGWFIEIRDEIFPKIYETHALGDINSTYLEVAGNIYENPELLNENKENNK